MTTTFTSRALTALGLTAVLAGCASRLAAPPDTSTPQPAATTVSATTVVATGTTDPSTAGAAVTVAPTSTSASTTVVDHHAELEQLVATYDDAFNRADWPAFAALLAPDFVDHSPEPNQTPDKAGFLQISQMSRSAFPDWHITDDDVVVDGDRVAIRFHGDGTLGAKHVHMTGMRMFQVHDGLLTATWANWDALGFYHQLGIQPPA